MNTKTALYTRVSSAEQAEHGVSLAEQRERLEAWAKLEGWEVAGIYTDEGYSGGTDDRPELHRLMRDAQARLFSVVAVTKLDRLFRNNRLLLNFIYQLELHGISFVAQAEGIDTSKPGMGKVILSLLGSVAEWERERIGSRIKDFRQHLARKGQWSSGRTPFGYRFDKKAKELIIDPLEAEAVRFIFDTYTQGNIGIIRTAEACNAQGLITPRPGRRQHTTWNQSVIRYILTHPAYRGGPNESWSFKIPAIVKFETWELAQRQLATNRHFRESETHSPYQGLLRCGLCNHTLRIGYNHNVQKVWECPGRLKRLHLDDSPRCQLPRLSTDELENGLTQEVRRIFRDPATIRQYIVDTIKGLQKERRTLEQRLRPIQHSLDRIEKQLEKADTMYQADRLSATEYKARVAGLSSLRKQLENQATEADPMLLRQLAENEREIAYLQSITEWADYQQREIEKEAVRKQATKDEIDRIPDDMLEEERLAAISEILKKSGRPEPVFSPETLQLISKLQDGGKGTFIADLSLFDSGLAWIPESDIITNPHEVSSRLLRKLGMYVYVYAEKLEIKGAVRQTNVSSACKDEVSLPLCISLKLEEVGIK